MKGAPDASKIASPQTAAVIELQMIEELKSLDDGEGLVLKQLVEMFADGGVGRIALIAKFFAAGDLKRVNYEAHSLKSSAANLGAHRVSAICQQLEYAKTAGEAKVLAHAPAQLQVEFDQACAALRRLLG